MCNYTEIGINSYWNGKKISGILSSSFDCNKNDLVVIVPGLFGDRCDSRSMFTQLSRLLSENGYSVTRFDFLGYGLSEGLYENNTLLYFEEILFNWINNIQTNFPFLNKVVLIGFSDGIKTCISLSIKRNDVILICSCNGLITKESIYNPIERPKLINGKFVYNSYYGVWVNWGILREYNQYFIENFSTFNTKLVGVYSTNDVFTKESRKYFQEHNYQLELIEDADHLFTSSQWVNAMKKGVLKLLNMYIPNTSSKTDFFTMICGYNLFVHNEDNKREKTIVFVHGLGQTKAGAGHLYSFIKNSLGEKYNYCFFDFPGSGDSYGDLKDLTFELMNNILSEILEFIKKNHNTKDIILVGSGIGNYIISNNTIQEEYIRIFLFPKESIIDWKKILGNMQYIDTSDFFETNINADDEFKILGNVYNRTKGMILNTELLVEYQKEFKLTNLNKYGKSMILYNDKMHEKIVKNPFKIFIDDASGLLMDAQKRDEAVSIINDFLRSCYCG